MGNNNHLICIIIGNPLFDVFAPQDGKSLLHVALARGSLAAAGELVEAGCAPSALDQVGPKHSHDYHCCSRRRLLR